MQSDGGAAQKSERIKPFPSIGGGDSSATPTPPTKSESLITYDQNVKRKANTTSSEKELTLYNAMTISSQDEDTEMRVISGAAPLPEQSAFDESESKLSENDGQTLIISSEGAGAHTPTVDAEGTPPLAESSRRSSDDSSKESEGAGRVIKLSDSRPDMPSVKVLKKLIDVVKSNISGYNSTTRTITWRLGLVQAEQKNNVKTRLITALDAVKKEETQDLKDKLNIQDINIVLTTKGTLYGGIATALQNASTDTITYLQRTFPGQRNNVECFFRLVMEAQTELSAAAQSRREPLTGRPPAK